MAKFRLEAIVLPGEWEWNEQAWRVDAFGKPTNDNLNRWVDATEKRIRTDGPVAPMNYIVTPTIVEARIVAQDGSVVTSYQNYTVLN